MNHSHRGRNLPAPFFPSFFSSLFSGSTRNIRLRKGRSCVSLPRLSILSFPSAELACWLGGKFCRPGTREFGREKADGTGHRGVQVRTSRGRSADLSVEDLCNSRGLETIIRKRRDGLDRILSHPLQTLALSPRIINSHARSLRKKGKKLFLEASDRKWTKRNARFAYRVEG